jgi:acyl carrier protein
VLINTNFGAVNHRVSSLVLENQPHTTESDTGRYHSLVTRHKAALFSHFKDIVPKLSHAFPDVAIVVRPHPVEDNGPWKDAATDCPNVHVVHEGNVIPWLLAAKVLVQNSCTTAVEAYVLGRPVVNYQPVRSERFDDKLCMSLSHCSFDFEDLRGTLREILDGRLCALDGPDQRKLITSRFAGIDGPLAADRIIDVLERIASENSPPHTNPGTYASAWCTVYLRSLAKQLRSWIPGDKNNRSYQDHRFPGIAVAEIQSRIDRLRQALGRFDSLNVERFGRNIFEITAAGAQLKLRPGHAMKPQEEPTRDQIGTTVLKHLKSRLLENGLAADSIEDGFDLIEVEILDSFAFVELVVSVSEDLDIYIDLADLGDEPITTFGEIVTAFQRVISAETSADTQATD